MNPVVTQEAADTLIPPKLPPPVQELLQRFIRLAHEIEPYVLTQSEDSIYIDYKQGSWTEAMLERFRREITRTQLPSGSCSSPPAMPGRRISYRDFLAQSSWTNIQVRSELGAISKIARKLFGKKVWPVRTRQGSDGVMRYLMPKGIAEWWMSGGVGNPQL